MNDNENRRHQMFVRVHDFGIAHSGDFAATSLGKQLFTNLAGVVNELESKGASEVTGGGMARQGTTTRKQARAELREDLEAINRTARAMADTNPGLDDKFRVPRDNNDQQLLNAARAFAIDALPLKQQFIDHELPANFLEDLNADIDAMESAMSDQSSGVGHRVAAAAAIDDAIDRGVDLVRKLDAIVRNKYSNNPATLAEWTTASHTERAPKRRGPVTPGVSAPGSSSSPPSSGSPAPPA